MTFFDFLSSLTLIQTLGFVALFILILSVVSSLVFFPITSRLDKLLTLVRQVELTEEANKNER